MANKKVILSNGAGKNQISPTVSGNDSFYIDDTTDTLVVKSGSLAVLQIGSSGGILSASNGVVTNITGASGSMLVANGSVWTSVASTIPVGAAGGDLTGSYPVPQVKSVANVTAGTLAVANGGTNKNTLLVNDVLTGSSAGVGPVAGTIAHDVVIYHNGSSWTYSDRRPSEIIEGNTTGAGTWTKPAGARLIKVYLQAAGGGGSSGWLRNSTANNVVGGGGGGSGGYSEVWFNVSNLADGATIPYYVGNGGAGGFRNTNNGTTAGGDGERTAFGVSGSSDIPTATNAKFFAQASGGKAGTNTNTVATGGAGGFGNISNGTAGGSLASFSATPSAGTVNSKGASGGGAGGGVSSTASVRDGASGGASGELYINIGNYVNGGDAGIGALNTNGGSGGSGNNYNFFPTLVTINDTGGSNMFLGSGGGGGGASGGTTPAYGGIGGSGGIGAGGGGGGAGFSNNVDGNFCQGGDGGQGFIIIITYF